MRRFLVVVLCALFGAPLLAATPALFIKPTVVVYPFTAASSSLDREASSRLATIIATQMANTGRVTVTPPPPGTERKDYLSVARAHNADYYISGYISPLGAGVSVVEQVVSSSTGIVIYSQTAQLSTYGDAAGQGDDLADYIARHANRGLAAIGTPPPQASPTPAASPEANLGKLFGRRKKAAATPKPAVASTAPIAIVASAAPKAAIPVAAVPATATPKAVAAAPAPATAAAETYAVLMIEGPADAALRELATQRLTARTGGERVAGAAAACAARRVRAVLTGALAVRAEPQFGGGSATFELTASDCAGKMLWRQSHSNDAGGAQGLQVATERAVDAAAGAYLNPPKRRRR